MFVGLLEGSEISSFYRTHQNMIFTWRREQSQLPKRSGLVLEF
jgi:hypothetical protein